MLAVVVPGPRTSPRPVPDWYADLDDLPADTVVLSDWGEGGYLMWRFPELDFVVNGYGDIYTDDELARNYRMDATEPRLGGDVKETGARYALLRPGSRLTYGLDTLEGWTVLDRSDTCVLLEAPDDWPTT